MRVYRKKFLLATESDLDRESLAMSENLKETARQLWEVALPDLGPWQHIAAINENDGRITVTVMTGQESVNVCAATDIVRLTFEADQAGSVGEVTAARLARYWQKKRQSLVQGLALADAVLLNLANQPRLSPV